VGTWVVGLGRQNGMAKGSRMVATGWLALALTFLI
jgi:hypothetical protein